MRELVQRVGISLDVANTYSILSITFSLLSNARIDPEQRDKSNP